MRTPKSILDVIKTVEQKHKSDIDKAINEAEKQIHNLPEFEDFVRPMIRSAIRALIQDRRHEVNIIIKRGGNPKPDGKPKVIVGRSKILRKVVCEWYDKRIAGRVLGDIKGRELGELAQEQFNMASGYKFNAMLFKKLQTLVPPDKTVRQSVPATKLIRIVSNLQRSLEKGVA